MNAFKKFRLSDSIFLKLVAAFLLITSIYWITTLSSASDKLASASLAGSTAMVLISFKNEVLSANGKSIKEVEDDLKDSKFSYEITAKMLIRALQENLPLDILIKEAFPYVTPKTQEKILSFSELLEGYLKRIDICHELAKYLEKETTQKRLQGLARDVCDRVLENTDQYRIDRNHLDKRQYRFRFYEDVYIYLRVWLKNSIKYDIVMQDINRSIKDRDFYTEAFEYLQNEISLFFEPKLELKVSTEDSKVILQDYLRKLIEKVKDSEI